jgi:hypothetical protein
VKNLQKDHRQLEASVKAIERARAERHARAEQQASTPQQQQQELEAWPAAREAPERAQLRRRQEQQQQQKQEEQEALNEYAGLSACCLSGGHTLACCTMLQSCLLCWR